VADFAFPASMSAAPTKAESVMAAVSISVFFMFNHLVSLLLKACLISLIHKRVQTKLSR
jgi:hypothetical protein